jgi:hypothetical protein
MVFMFGAAGNPELTRLASQTKQREVREAITKAVYGVIASAYSALARAAEQMCARKLSGVAPLSPPTVGKGIQIDLGPDDQEFNVHSSAAAEPAETSGQEVSEKPPVESVQTQVRQGTHLASLCLAEVKERLLPAAAELSISMDAPTVHTWAMAIFLAVSRAQTLK